MIEAILLAICAAALRLFVARGLERDDLYVAALVAIAVLLIWLFAGKPSVREGWIFIAFSYLLWELFARLKWRGQLVVSRKHAAAGYFAVIVVSLSGHWRL